MLTRRIKIQLGIFAVVAVVATSVMMFGYVQLPNLLFGVGSYHVNLNLTQTGGLYKNANVTYRGTEVGRVEDLRFNDDGGVQAVLSLNPDIKIPADLDAEVHSVSAIGEQYVALIPRGDDDGHLANGDVIPVDRTSVPPDINTLVDATNRGLQAIPRENLKTAIDEAYTAVGGLGPDLSRIVTGSTDVAIDTHKDLDSLTTLIDQSGPILDSQAATSGSIQAWASHLADVTEQLQSRDAAVGSVLEKTGPAVDEGQKLFERLQPTLPILMANLVSVGQVAVTYQNDIEQLLVLLPQGVSAAAATIVPNHGTKNKGLFLDFNLNLNLPPACTTGFLPASQMRSAVFEDYPDRPAGDLYCRVPQDSVFNVRGARNIPCETVPGKRAPTVKMCESDEEYVPLNEGFNWKGDPNATNSGQDIPQLPPGESAPAQGAPPPVPPAPEVPALATAEYNPVTGTYIGPNGNVYTQRDLAQTGSKGQTWQSMLTPPS